MQKGVRIEPTEIFAEVQLLQVVQAEEGLVLDGRNAVQSEIFELIEMLEQTCDDVLDGAREELQAAYLRKASSQLATVERTEATGEAIVLQREFGDGVEHDWKVFAL